MVTGAGRDLKEPRLSPQVLQIYRRGAWWWFGAI
ncbi:Uncharacterized protein APZ42_009371 [Daphnia magna]|uniref:Uncharacterized protein n=1 Tax=Daphnia magna TaxID=35525 RepID=A0A162CYZ7_9CRUS|nr:Uncharacterized protein APZ42_009371 [Daphnia magna]